MFANLRKGCQCAIVGVTISLSPVAMGQVIIRVDGDTGSASPLGLGDDWDSDAYLYLQIKSGQFRLI